MMLRGGAGGAEFSGRGCFWHDAKAARQQPVQVEAAGRDTLRSITVSSMLPVRFIFENPNESALPSEVCGGADAAAAAGGVALELSTAPPASTCAHDNFCLEERLFTFQYEREMITASITAQRSRRPQ